MSSAKRCPPSDPNPVTEIVKCSRNAVVLVRSILARHTENQFPDLSPDGRPSRIAVVFRAVELLSDQLSIPRQNGVRPGYAGHLLEWLTSEPFANFCHRRSLPISQPEPRGQMRPEDSVFSDRVLVLLQDLLIHHSGNKG
jgi:hypothetical protein